MPPARPPEVAAPSQPLPTVETPQAGLGGGQDGQLPERPPTPQAPLESQPPIAAASPRTVGEDPLAETPATYAAQRAALLDPANPKEAVVYAKDAQPIDLPRGNPRYQQGVLADGRVIQYDRNGPSGLRKNTVGTSETLSRLNDILDYGPYNKEDIDARLRSSVDASGTRIEGGSTERPVTIVERNPQGIEVKAAFGTDQTATEQAAHFERTKGVGNTISVEPTENVLADRVAGTEGSNPAGNLSPAEAGTVDTPFGPGRRVAAQGAAEPTFGERPVVRPAERTSVGDQLKAKQQGKDPFVRAQPILERLKRTDLAPADRETAMAGLERMMGSREAAEALLRGSIKADRDRAAFADRTARERAAFGDDMTARATGRSPRSATSFKTQAMSEPVSRSVEGQARGTITSVRNALTTSDPKMRLLVDQLTRLVGDTPVHRLPHDELVAATGRNVRGAYDTESGRILLSAEHARPDTILHEAFHAATAESIAAKPELQNLLGRLRDEAVSNVADQRVGEAVRASDGEEFLARLMTDPTLEASLRDAPISAQLAKDIGNPPWRPKTLWEGFLNLARKALGLGPRQITAVEAAARISNRILDRTAGGREPITQGVSRGADQFRFQDVTAGPARGEPVDVNGPAQTDDLENGVAPARFAAAANRGTNTVRAALRDAPLFGSATVRTITAKFRDLTDTPLDWVARAKEKGWGLSGAAQRWANGMTAQDGTRERIVKQSTPLMDRLGALSHSNPSEFEKLSKLLVSSAVNNVDASDPLGVGRNLALAPTVEQRTAETARDAAFEKFNAATEAAKEPVARMNEAQKAAQEAKGTNREKATEAAAKTARDAAQPFIDDFIAARDAHDAAKDAVRGAIANRPKEDWTPINGHPEDRNAYNSLSPEGKDLYKGSLDLFVRQHDAETVAGRQALVDRLRENINRKGDDGKFVEVKDRRDAVSKVLDGKQLEGEEKVHHNDDDAIQALRDYDKMAAQTKRRVYFPLDHGDGSHVVTGEHDYSLPTNPAGNVERFSDNPDSPDYHRIVFENKKDALSFDPRNAAGEKLPVEHYTVEGEHHVVVNPREVVFANGNFDGEKVRNQMLASGMDPKKVSAVQPRAAREPWQQSSSASMVREQIKRLDKMPDLTDSDRERMADAIKHVAATSMPPSRLRSSMLERDRTGGAGRDILRDMDKARRQSAARQAAMQHRDAIDSAMQEMHEYIDKNPSHADAGAIRQMVNKFKDTNKSFTKDASSVGTNRFWNFISAYNAFNGLVSPSFHFLHSLHLPLTVIPDIAADIGPAKAALIAAKVMRRMLPGEIGTAGKSMGRALGKGWQSDFKPTDFNEALRHDLNLTPEETAMFKYLSDRGVIQHSGMDFSHANEGSSALAQASARLRDFNAEFIGSADVANKHNSALMYAEAGKLKGLEGDALHQYVADGITRTQGQYANWNKATLFKNPALRAVLQYKQFLLMLAKMNAKYLWQSFAPTRLRDANGNPTGKWGYHAADWETRARALKTLTYMTVAAGLMSGVRGAVPWPVRVADDLLHLLGITDGWEKHMDELQQGFAKTLGPTGANAMMNGVGAPLGLYIGHRGSLSDPLGLAYLLETSPHGSGDPEGSVLKWLAGAPGTTANNMFSAADSLFKGDPGGMLTHLVPRIIGDPIKALHQYSEGVSTSKGKLISPPVSLWQSALTGVGLENMTTANARFARSITGQEAAQQHDNRHDILDQARKGDMAGALRALNAFNRANPNNRMTPVELQRAKTTKPTILGYPENARNKAEMEQRQRDYGLTQ